MREAQDSCGTLARDAAARADFAPPGALFAHRPSRVYHHETPWKNATTAAAAPLPTSITSSGGPTAAKLPIPFSIEPGGNTALNLTYNTAQGFRLWDISVLTGVPQSYKIMPGDIAIIAASIGS